MVRAAVLPPDLAGALYDQSTTRVVPRAILLLGDASYSLYLVHFGAIVLASVMLDRVRTEASRAPNLTLAVVSVLILVFGVVVHLSVERPLLNALRHRIGGRGR